MKFTLIYYYYYLITIIINSIITIIVRICEMYKNKLRMY